MRYRVESPEPESKRLWGGSLNPGWQQIPQEAMSYRPPTETLFQQGKIQDFRLSS